VAFKDLAALVDAIPDALVVIDENGVLRHANKSTERLFGWTIAEKTGTSAFDLVHPDDLENALLSLASVVDKEVGSPIELRVRSTSGWRLVELIGAPYPGEDVEGGIVLTMRDLTDRRMWEIAGQDDSKFRVLVQNGAGLTALVSQDGHVLSISGAVARQLGYDAAKVIGSSLHRLVDDADRPKLSAALAQARENADCSADERRVSCEVQVRHGSGHVIPFQLTIIDLVDDPTVNGFVITGHDVTELHKTRVELAHTASHDALTGLPNRIAIRDHLSERLQEADGSQRIAVGFVDLDRFKPVNDLFGHEAGDELLIAVAGRLQASLRKGDIVGRFGGDEFTIITTAANLGEAISMAERLEDSIAQPFKLSSGTVQVHASIGVALAEPDSTVQSLLGEADAAMYSVKNGRRGTPQNARRSVSARRSIVEALSVAFSERQFVVHYQPIVDLHSRATLGHEALVRWNHPERGLLMPSQFLDVVKELGLDTDIGKFVLAQALHDLTLLDAAKGTTTEMSVNIGVSQLVDPSFPAMVASALRDAGIPPDRLIIEVSERTMLERSANGPPTPVMAGLQSLKKLGVKIAAEDFGTGYSSLTHLVSYPINSLKIDRSFVSSIHADSHRRTIVAALISLAHGLNLTSVAEGVEEPEQDEILRELGCETAQGYLYGRPVPLEAAMNHSVPEIQGTSA